MKHTITMSDTASANVAASLREGHDVILSRPFETDNVTLDIFLIGGQSNAVGQGDSSESPLVKAGVGYVYDGSDVVHLADPVVDANTGSAWPAFANKWFELTGHASFFIPTAVNGAGQVYGTSGDSWDNDGGELYDDAITLWNAGYAAAKTLTQYTPKIKGVLWCQGERDGTFITNETITKAQYKAELSSMIGRFQSDVGGNFYIFRTGTLDNGDTIGMQSVREAQDEVVASTANVEMLFTGAIDFPANSMMGDNVHYTQAGYNLMGETGAKKLSIL